MIKFFHRYASTIFSVDFVTFDEKGDNDVVKGDLTSAGFVWVRAHVVVECGVVEESC